MRRLPLLALPLFLLLAFPVAYRGARASSGPATGTSVEAVARVEIAPDSAGAIATALVPTPTTGTAVRAANPSASSASTATATAALPATVAQPTASPTAASRAVASTPSPSRIASGIFYSVTLNRTIDYLVYVPAGYDSDSTRRYPVLYDLHGMSGSPDEWLRYGTREAADALFASGVSPYLIVFPRGDQGYWIDQADGGPQWATYVAKDVVAEIDGHYRTLTDRGDRAIGGLSMGGHGALQIAINHPDVFGIAGANSPSFREDKDVQAYFGTREERALRDPRDLYAAHPDVARTLKLWLDFGPADFFVGEQLRFEQILLDEGIPHEFHEYPGGHATEYWTANVGTYLAFYSRSFAYGR